jgi:hypothetical protein
MNATAVTREQLAEEAHRARKVRQIVDIAATLIMQAGMTRPDAEKLVALVRDRVLALFPGREQTYELIYAPRFNRLIDEFARPVSPGPSIVVPFPSTSR